MDQGDAPVMAFIDRTSTLTQSALDLAAWIVSNRPATIEYALGLLEEAALHWANLVRAQWTGWL